MKGIDESLSLKSFLAVPVKDYLLLISSMKGQFWLQLLQHISVITRNDNIELYSHSKVGKTEELT